MSNEKIILFSHWNYIDPDEWKETIEDWYDEDYDEISDDDKWQYLANEEDTAYEDLKAELEAVVGNHSIVCIGTVGRWDGTYEGGFLAENVQEVFNKVSGRDMGYFDVFIEEGELNVSFTHHDGTNTVVARILTDAGQEYIWSEIDEWEVDTSETHRILFESDEYSSPLLPTDLM